MANYLRLNVVLAEKGLKQKWLAKEIGKAPGTVSKWCNNKDIPSIETLFQIAKILEVSPCDLLQPANNVNSSTLPKNPELD